MRFIKTATVIFCTTHLFGAELSLEGIKKSTKDLSELLRKPISPENDNKFNNQLMALTKDVMGLSAETKKQLFQEMSLNDMVEINQHIARVQSIKKNKLRLNAQEGFFEDTVLSGAAFAPLTLALLHLYEPSILNLYNVFTAVGWSGFLSYKILQEHIPSVDTIISASLPSVCGGMASLISNFITVNKYSDKFSIGCLVGMDMIFFAGIGRGLFLYMRERKTLNALGARTEKLGGFQQDLLSHYMQTTEPNNDWRCSICWTDEKDKKYQMLGCKHVHHFDCLQEWLKNNNNCPLCRTELTD